jgi:cytochrome b
MSEVQTVILTQQEKTINIMVRVFHWSIVILFTILFITGDNNNGADALHIISGYLLISMLVARILWGVIGDDNALWKNYLYHPKMIFVYLVKLFSSSTAKFKIHNPAGSSMILMMITLLLVMSISGLLLESIYEFDGVLLFVTGLITNNQSVIIKEVHGIVAHIMLFAIAFHLIGVGYSSYKYRVNMPLMMITGKINNWRKK